MEGLLPFLYRAILHLASGGQSPTGNPFFRNDSPPESPLAAHYYVRLAAGADVPAFLSSAARGYYDRGLTHDLVMQQSWKDFGQRCYFLKYLTSNESVPDNFPFEIIDEEGISVVSLRRDYKYEKIEVTVSMANLVGGPEFGDEDGEADGESAAKDDEEAEDSKHFSRPGPKLEFTIHNLSSGDHH
ncbi:hypothetical protein ZEAMMB73_Zm00001d039882 [Zea mays]|uniref:Uncharacterized protein n=1 Tax=Zea mays TaxID=4577 RepID=A0A1D6MLK2_MAIZE|nr:hypothetical protein ZEAMMB73_Zm00001d039882 [Zea mays]